MKNLRRDARRPRWQFIETAGRYAAWKGDTLIGELFERDGFWWLENLPGGILEAAGSTFAHAKRWLKGGRR